MHRDCIQQFSFSNNESITIESAINQSFIAEQSWKTKSLQREWNWSQTELLAYRWAYHIAMIWMTVVLQTPLSGTQQLGTVPHAKSKDFWYSYCYTLFQIMLGTKGAQLQAQLPSVKDYGINHISGVQVSKLYPLMNLSTQGSLGTFGWGHQDKGAEPLALCASLHYTMCNSQGKVQ